MTSSLRRRAVTTYQPNGKELVRLGTTVEGEGTVTTYQHNGKELVRLTTNPSGGGVLSAVRWMVLLR